MNLNPRPYLRPITIPDIVVYDPPLSFYIPKVSYRKSIYLNIEYIREHIEYCEKNLENQEFLELSDFTIKYYKVELLKAQRSLQIFYKRASILAA